MNPLMNPVGSNAEGKLNCINAVVITHVGANVISFAPTFFKTWLAVFFCGAGRRLFLRPQQGAFYGLVPAVYELYALGLLHG